MIKRKWGLTLTAIGLLIPAAVFGAETDDFLRMQEMEIAKHHLQETLHPHQEQLEQYEVDQVRLLEAIDQLNDKQEERLLEIEEFLNSETFETLKSLTLKSNEEDYPLERSLHNRSIDALSPLALELFDVDRKDLNTVTKLLRLMHEDDRKLKALYTALSEKEKAYDEASESYDVEFGKDQQALSTLDSRIEDFNEEQGGFETDELLGNHLTDLYDEHEFTPYKKWSAKILDDALEEAVDRDLDEIIDETDQSSNLESYSGSFADIGSNYDFIWPTTSTRVTSNYGMRNGRMHNGTDIGGSTPGQEGEPIFSIESGTVTQSAYHHAAGHYVRVNHGNGLETRYLHLQSPGASVGTTVEQGDVVGRLGNTGRSSGAHLHFEIIIDGQPQNPMNFYNH